MDRYGRLIAICFVGGKDLNAMMVGELCRLGNGVMRGDKIRRLDIR